LVAHNASFDIGVLRSLFAHYALETDPLQYYCTVKLARRTFKGLKKYGLANLSNHFGISLDHHNAKSDAAACAIIMMEVCKEIGVTSLSDLQAHFGQTGWLKASAHRPYSIKKSSKKN